jgi:hypothetical protein
MQAPEQAVPVFATQFARVIYNEPNTIPQFSGQLAPLVGVALNAQYVTGQLLAQYNAHAPAPANVGQFVNYSAAASNLDQQVCVAILTENWVSTAGGDGNFYSIAYLQPPLVLSGTQMALANEPADITAFLAAFPSFEPPLGSLLGAVFNGAPDQIYILK